MRVNLGLGAAPYFSDVPATHPFFAQIQRVKEMGITNGCAVDPLRFCPDDPVNRGQMAAFLVRALEPAQQSGGSGIDAGGKINIFGYSISPMYAIGGVVVLALLLRR